MANNGWNPMTFERDDLVWIERGLRELARKSIEEARQNLYTHHASGGIRAAQESLEIADRIRFHADIDTISPRSPEGIAKRRFKDACGDDVDKRKAGENAVQAMIRYGTPIEYAYTTIALSIEQMNRQAAALEDLDDAKRKMMDERKRLEDQRVRFQRRQDGGDRPIFRIAADRLVHADQDLFPGIPIVPSRQTIMGKELESDAPVFSATPSPRPWRIDPDAPQSPETNAEDVGHVNDDERVSQATEDVEKANGDEQDG